MGCSKLARALLPSVRQVARASRSCGAQGQAVEVSYTEEGSQEPAAWWEAKIVSKKGAFCKVNFLGGGFADDVVDEGIARREQRDETGSISVHHANDRPTRLWGHTERCLLRPVDVEVELKRRR